LLLGRQQCTLLQELLAVQSQVWLLHEQYRQAGLLEP
jgi:hypothetical protein